MRCSLFFFYSHGLSLRKALVTGISEFEKDTNLRNVLLDAAKAGNHLKFFG